MRVIYQGPFDAVEIAETGQIAEQGKPVDLPGEIAENLLSQGDPDHPTWKKAGRAKKEAD